MELPANPDQYIEESQARRRAIQGELSRLATEHEALLADELAVTYEVLRLRSIESTERG